METSFLPLHYFPKGIFLSLQSHFIVIIISSLRGKGRRKRMFEGLSCENMFGRRKETSTLATWESLAYERLEFVDPYLWILIITPTHL